MRDRGLPDSLPAMSPSTPSPGQLVTVRQRRSVVTGVVPSVLPSDSDAPV